MTTEILGYMADPTEEERAEKERAEYMKKVSYFTRQRALGIIALITGIIAAFISTEGIVASIFLVPFGGIMVLSNKEMMTEEEEIHEEYHKRTV